MPCPDPAAGSKTKAGNNSRQMRDAHKGAAGHRPLPRSAVPLTSGRWGTGRSQERGWPPCSRALPGWVSGRGRCSGAGGPARPAPPPPTARPRARAAAVPVSCRCVSARPGGPALHAHGPQPTLTSAGRGGAEAGPADACALPPFPGP